MIKTVERNDPHILDGSQGAQTSGRRTMCVNCTSDGIGRRDFMKFSAAGAIALGVGGAPPAARAEEGAPTALSPQDALAALKSGNERYVSSPELCT
ncbi:MAG TPA: twin-arginine translocation signal domain-containing protein, partial [Roseiarcus sp.]|nr:twin-arginine translocation signal domain-containing protein [Roseiarcus sp.]